MMIKSFLCFTFLTALLAALPATGDDSIFESRLLPLAQSPKSSSCTECHFSGVELGNFVGKTEAETFASLRDQGLINIEQPEKSKILSFISRHGKNTNELIQKTRKKELEAFQSWIEHAVKNPKLLATGKGKKLGTDLPPEVIRHLRSDRVLESFYENIWVELGRCVNCHSPQRNAAQVKKHGEQMSWIVPGDLGATLKRCVEQQIIDLDDPEESQILTKPNGTAEHGGGPKFAVGSESDKSFRTFLIDYSKTVAGSYRLAKDLPKSKTLVRHPTFQFLKISNIPKAYSDKFLQVRLFQKTTTGWSKTPIAVAGNPVNGEQSVWMASLFQYIDKDSERFIKTKEKEYSTLPESRFLVKVFVDVRGRLQKSPNESLGEDDLVITFETGPEWGPGYLKPKTYRWKRAE